MQGLILTGTAGEIASSGRITPADVVALGVDMFRDGAVSRGEAGTLFELDRICDRKCGDWMVFLIEAVTEHVVGRTPGGHVSDEAADWLVSSIARAGRIAGETELELLIHVFERAGSVPQALSVFALEQVAHAVIDGGGELARGREQPAGIVGAEEVDLMRLVLGTSGGPSNLAISRAEAEILFRINDRTVEEMNDPSWNELFIKAIANHVLAGTGHSVPTRAEAVRRDALFATAEWDLAGFFRRMVAASLEAARVACEAARVDEAEAVWLLGRMTRGRLIRDNERALVALIKAEASEIHPAMAPLLAKAA